MTNIAIFASGSGTNAENIIRYFSDKKSAMVACVVTNNPKAGVIERVGKLGIKVEVFSKPDFNAGEKITGLLKKNKIDFIVLAGFLLLIPERIISAYNGKIINIHPALLPQHGGAGFYGNKVHESVLKNGSPISGITIHQVNEKFDEGEIIFQAACHIDKNETAQSLTEKIHSLEYTYYPVVIEKVIKSIWK